MAGQVQPPEDWALIPREQPTNPDACLTALPTELHFMIINLALAVGQERDVAALARTSKTMYDRVNYELHRLVVRHKRFLLLHWAAQENQLDTLKLALEYGADPNQMRTSAFSRYFKTWGFRPLGWNLTTSPDYELDAATKRKLDFIYFQRLFSISPAHAPGWRHSREVWFTSTASLSTATSAQISLLVNHYIRYYSTHMTGRLLDNDRARLVELPPPLDENFAFPQNMSPADMDRRDVKISFVRMFQHWDTPLHIAAAHDRVSVTATLLANGGDVDCTATDVCGCLRDAEPSSAGPVQRGITQDIFTYTPFHVAICKGSYRAAKVLVASGADRMARIFRSNGAREWLAENALHRALCWRHGARFDYDFVEFLLDRGYAARIEERNFEGMTPLQIACQGLCEPAQEPARMDILRLLSWYGADPNSQCLVPPGSRSLMTARHPVISHDDMATIGLWATRLGNFRCAKLLLDYGADARATSSTTQHTMLFVVCTTSNEWLTPYDDHHRNELLDALLARGTAKDLNAFYGDDNNLLIRLIRARIFKPHPKSRLGEWESKVFTAGADIMAGTDMGKPTPLDRMITDVLRQPFDWTRDSWPGQMFISDLCRKVLVILRASGINKHPHRPTAMLNQFWADVKRVPRHIGIALFVLPALLGAGFSPAEVDSHGDTAMTSFLQHLLDNPLWATHDSNHFGSEGWILPMIMAMLQEHDAALYKINNKGFTAFDYLHQITDYEGNDEGLIMLRNVMRRSVGICQDGHRASFKFHPMRPVGRIDGDDTVERLFNNRSRWLVCKYLCERRNCRFYVGTWRCRHQTDSTWPADMCKGDCWPSPTSGYRRQSEAAGFYSSE